MPNVKVVAFTAMSIMRNQTISSASRRTRRRIRIIHTARPAPFVAGRTGLPDAAGANGSAVAARARKAVAAAITLPGAATRSAPRIPAAAGSPHGATAR